MNYIIYSYFDTKLGKMIAGTTEKGLCLLEFEERKNLEYNLARLEKKHSAKLVEGKNEILEQTISEITEYFEGNLWAFTVPLDIKGTDFQKQVWNTLVKIPPGETMSYLKIAKFLNRPTSFRAVAQINANNNIAIIIPCHRVIASNGKLQGYAGGLWRKEYLLKHEKNAPKVNKNPNELDELTHKSKLLETFF